jgi:hypothetical protein
MKQTKSKTIPAKAENPDARFEDISARIRNPQNLDDALLSVQVEAFARLKVARLNKIRGLVWTPAK